MAAFWDKRRVVSLKYTNVSEVRTASIIRAVNENEMSVYLNETIRRCVPESCHLFSVIYSKNNDIMHQKLLI
jgi:hypothetical protein